MSRAADLDHYLTGVHGLPFDWPTWNCWHFASAWLQLCGLANPMAGLEATPSRHAAWRRIKELGDGIADAWTKRSGLVPVAPALAQVGDVVLVVTLAAGGDNDMTLGLCCGRTAAVVTLDAGIGQVPMAWATHAWRVPA